jgi:hypothetical protein
MKLNVFVVLILLVSTYAAAQSDTDKITQNIRGKVIDKDSKSPLPGATVLITSAEPVKGTSSDADGKFRFENVPVGRKDIKVSYVGYGSKQIRNLILKSGKELVLTIELEENVQKIDEVVVKGYRKDQPINDMAKVSARSFSIEETEKYAGSWGDPSRMAQNYAGVISAGDQRNDIIIRGNPPIGLLWRLEDMNIPNPNHFGALGATGGPVSILNNNVLTNSDFFTGAFPAEYGNALSGVFDLQMRNGNNEQREYVGQIGFNGFELGAEGPFSDSSRASYLANYRYSTLAVMEHLGLNTGVGAVPQYQDLSFKVNVPLENGNLSLFGIGGLSYIELGSGRDSSANSYDTYEGTETRNGSDMGTAGLSYLHFFDKDSRLKIGLNYSANRVTTTVDSIATENREEKMFFHENNTQQKIGLYTKYVDKINAANILEIGMNMENYMISYVDSFYHQDYNKYVKELDIQKNNLMLYQAYGQLEHRFNNELSLYSGLNFQYFGYNQTWSLEPRLSIEWEINSKQSLNAGYGYHSQLQPLFLYFVQTRTGPDEYIMTNTDMGFSKSNQWVLGYNYSFNPNLRLKVEGYYQQQHNIPVTEYDSYFSLANYGSSFHLTRVDSLVNEGTSRNYGIDITFEKFFDKNYYFLVTASLFDSKYRGSNDKLTSTAFNNNFVVNALAGYELPLSNRSTLAFNIRMVTAGGKRYTPIDLKESRKYDEPRYIKEQAYEKQFKDYFRLDGRISYKKDGKDITQEWAIDITNITDHKNIFSRSYSPTTNDIKTEYQQRFFPMMLYRINF